MQIRPPKTRGQIAKHNATQPSASNSQANSETDRTSNTDPHTPSRETTPTEPQAPSTQRHGIRSHSLTPNPISASVSRSTSSQEDNDILDLLQQRQYSGDTSLAQIIRQLRTPTSSSDDSSDDMSDNDNTGALVFYGDGRTSEDAALFFHKFEYRMEEKGKDDAAKCKFLKLALMRGWPARDDWYDKLPAETTTNWTLLEAAWRTKYPLKKHLKPNELTRTARFRECRLLDEHVGLVTETTNGLEPTHQIWANRIMDLADGTGMTETHLKDVALKELLPEVIRDVMELQRSLTWEKFVSAIAELDTDMLKRRATERARNTQLHQMITSDRARNNQLAASVTSLNTSIATLKSTPSRYQFAPSMTPYNPPLIHTGATSSFERVALQTPTKSPGGAYQTPTPTTGPRQLYNRPRPLNYPAPSELKDLNPFIVVKEGRFEKGPAGEAECKAEREKWSLKWGDQAATPANPYPVTPGFPVAAQGQGLCDSCGSNDGHLSRYCSNPIFPDKEVESRANWRAKMIAERDARRAQGGIRGGLRGSPRGGIPGTPSPTGRSIRAIYGLDALPVPSAFTEDDATYFDAENGEGLAQ